MNPSRNVKNDFILRAIKQFTDMFAAVLKKKQAGQLVEAKYELEQMYPTLFGIDYKTIQAMDVEILKTLLGSSQKIKTLIQMLDEHALLHESLGNIESAKTCSRKVGLLGSRR